MRSRMILSYTNIYQIGLIMRSLMSARTIPKLEHRTQTQQPMNVILPGYSNDLIRIVGECLEYEPDDRPTPRQLRIDTVGSGGTLVTNNDTCLRGMRGTRDVNGIRIRKPRHWKQNMPILAVSDRYKLGTRVRFTPALSVALVPNRVVKRQKTRQ